MKAAGKKEKGRRLELKFAKMLRDYDLDKNAFRMPFSGSQWAFKTDIKTSLPYSFECKNTEKLRFWEDWEQAESQSTMQKPPVVVYSCNHRPIMVYMKAETFLNILKELQDVQTNNK